MTYLERPGAAIFWETTGSGSPLLIIQGLGYSSDASWRLLPALSARHTVLNLDNRGVGRSDVPEDPFTIEDMAADAAAVVEAADLGPVHVLGMSMGGLIAQELTLERPDLVRTLTLGCTSPGGPDAVLLTEEVGELFVELADLPAEEAARKAAAVVYAKSTPARVVEADIQVRMARPTSRVGYAAQLAAVGKYAGTLPRLSELKPPVLILHGTADLIVPSENVEVLASAIPHATIHLLHEAGHIFTTDATDNAIAAILKFLDRADASDTARK